MKIKDLGYQLGSGKGESEEQSNYYLHKLSCRVTGS